MLLAEDTEWYSRPADSRCHHCGKVFTYRIDKYNHVVGVHGDKSGKRPKDDHPAWDSAPQQDVWGSNQPQESSWDTPSTPTWSVAPTPAEAAANVARTPTVNRKREGDKASGSPTRRTHDRARVDPEMSLLDRPEPLQKVSGEGHHPGVDSIPSIQAKSSVPAPKATGSTSKVAPSVGDSSETATIITKSTSSSASRQKSKASETSTESERRHVHSDLIPRRLADEAKSNFELFTCNVCSGEFLGQDKFFDHLSTQGHLEYPPRKSRYKCRVCKERFPEPVQLKRHIYKTSHHNPQSRWGHKVNEERVQRRRSRNSNDSMSSWPEPAEAWTEPTEHWAAQDRRTEPVEHWAAQEKRGEAQAKAGEEEDLIDLTSVAASESSISEPTQEEVTETAATIKPSTPPAFVTKLNPFASHFQPKLKPSAKEFTPASSDPPGTSIPTRNPVPDPPSPCPASCGNYFPAKSLVIHHLESGACLPTSAKLHIADLYRVITDTACAHDFIDGRYLRDLSLMRDVQEKYKSNAYPFMCPNEERCGMVFKEFWALWSHFERGDCRVETERVGEVKAMVEESLEDYVKAVVGTGGSEWVSDTSLEI